jgi:hypothetical protein
VQAGDNGCGEAGHDWLPKREAHGLRTPPAVGAPGRTDAGLAVVPTAVRRQSMIWPAHVHSRVAPPSAPLRGRSCADGGAARVEAGWRPRTHSALPLVRSRHSFRHPSRPRWPSSPPVRADGVAPGVPSTAVSVSGAKASLMGVSVSRSYVYRCMRSHTGRQGRSQPCCGAAPDRFWSRVGVAHGEPGQAAARDRPRGARRGTEASASARRGSARDRPGE